MADEQYQWLDGDAAERLLSGEPLDAVDDHVRAQAERLSAVLGEARRARPHPLSDDAGAPYAQGGELPGEAAALAAFRAARASHATRVDDAAGAGVFGRPGPGDSAAVLGDSGAVRIGSGAEKARTRWGRPVRYGLAAALAACTLGGVAMAGAGVIPTPFGGGREPGPGASVSAAPSDPDPLLSPTPGASESDPGRTDAGSAKPGGETEGDAPGSGHPSQGSGDPNGSGGIVPTPTDSALPRDQREEWYDRVVTGCRDYLAGKPMDAEKKRRIEASAGGPEGVRTFCTKVVSGEGRNSGDGDGGGDSDRDGGEGGSDGGSDDGKGEDRGDGSGGGNQHEGNGGAGAVVTPTSTAPTSTAPTSTAPTSAAPTATASATPTATPTATLSPSATTGVGGTGDS